MLHRLCIENLALVEHIEIPLGRGLNVLTGETGAGKSVLVSALSLVLGGRANTDVIRAGSQEGVVEALFEFPSSSEIVERMRARGIQLADGELVVRRVISRSGKGKATLNGQLVTVAMLAELVRGVVDITGQHEHVALLDPEGHLSIVDAFGELDAFRARVAAAHAEVLGYRAALDALTTDEAEKARREDYLKFSLDEIAGVDPRVNEVEELEAERKRLKNAAELAEGVRRAEGSLYSDDGAIVEAVGRVQNELARLSRMDERLQPISGAASSVLADLEELSRQLGRYQGALSSDPLRLEQIEDRVEAIRKLSRKHGGTIGGVLAARDSMADELAALEHEEARRTDLLLALEVEIERRNEHGRALSASRRRVVGALEKAVQSELVQLCMEKTTFHVALTALDEVGSRGGERAEIMISPNVGEPMRALRRIASGGELSRVLLAIKHVLAERSAVGTYVFDEIDTGMGGAVADVLGRKLKEVARSHQVVCVTHLPQVAAHAEAHFRVVKAEAGGRTTTRVGGLDEAERIEELSRMLGGVEITDRTRRLAREMLRKGGNEATGGGPSRTIGTRPSPSKRSAKTNSGS